MAELPRVASLHLYPIKSCRGIDVPRIELDVMGPTLDRRWMVVDEEGQFLTQREEPRLALVEPSIAGDALVVEAPDKSKLVIPLTSDDAPRTVVTVWRFQGEAVLEGDEAATWFSDVLDRPARLVRFAPDVVRSVSKRHTARDSRTAFSDGYPILLISEGSLAELNARLDVAVPMNRFRPNIVVRGVDAYAEDDWHELRIGGLGLDVVKACDRCVVTTVDQASGVAGKEPLKTLARYRRRLGHVLFGQNCVHHSPGHIDVGAAVEIVPP